MPRLRVSQRLRGRLKTLIQRGEQTKIADWSQGRPGGTKISQQKLSYFMNEHRGITLDDLDDIADYFEISIGELLGDTKVSELSPAETRMLHAFRALPEQYQDHLIAVVELASIAPRTTRGNFPLPRPHPAGINTAGKSTSPQPAPDSLAPHAPTPGLATRHPSELEHLRLVIAAVRDAIASTGDDPALSPGTSQVPDRPVSSPRAGKTSRRSLAHRLR